MLLSVWKNRSFYVGDNFYIVSVFPSLILTVVPIIYPKYEKLTSVTYHTNLDKRKADKSGQEERIINCVVIMCTT